MDEIAELKARLRDEIISARKARLSNAADLFTANLQQVVSELNPKRVAIYQAYKSEPQTEDFINQSTYPALAPITVNEQDLVWKELNSQTETVLIAGDLVFIPALAADKSGNRLGRGKAYFDRALSQIPEGVQVFAVVFDAEILDRIPTEPHDQKVNGLVSEAGIYKIN